MIEAINFWNEPNNLSHWDFQMDPEWQTYSKMVQLAASAVRELRPGLTRVLGGISPIDSNFMRLISSHGTLEYMDAVAVHGFPLDWNHWKLDEWPAKLAEIEAVTTLPVWVTEVGVSTFGAEEVQVFGLRRTAELLLGRAPRVYWYSLLDLPQSWGATTRHKESEGSAYYRHFYMGLIRHDGTPKPAIDAYDPALGICQWFHFHDERLDFAVDWLRRLGVNKLRTGISWADWHRPQARDWFDRQMDALAEFDTMITLCFTPPSRGQRECHTSPPQDAAEFAEFAAAVVERYAPAAPARKSEAPPEVSLSGAHTEQAVARLAPWFHNLHLPDGTQTAPDHLLGDFPRYKWDEIAPHLPERMDGLRALDVGCNAGYYSLELARRGAIVTAIDSSAHYLAQARWAAERFGLTDRIRFRQMQLYDLVMSRERYDVVLFMGVFYHLRYPLLGLDIVSRLTDKTLIFQSLTMPGEEVYQDPGHHDIYDREVFLQPGWPMMAFIERRFADDPTNWWAPNHAAIEAVLRTSGMRVVARPGTEIYVCEPDAELRDQEYYWREEFLAATGQQRRI